MRRRPAYYTKAVPEGLGAAQRRRPFVGRFCRRSALPPARWPHIDSGRLEVSAHRWLARSAATASRTVPVQESVVFCRRSIRCSYRRRLQCLSSASTSRATNLIGRFSGDHVWPPLGDHRGNQMSTACCGQEEGVNLKRSHLLVKRSRWMSSLITVKCANRCGKSPCTNGDR